MKLTGNEWLLRAGRQMRLGLCLMGMAMAWLANAQAVNTTTVQGTVYLANGQAGTGTLVVSWPAFTTANGQAVAADRMTLTIAPDGFVSVNLAPNLGATPAGLYYTAVFYLSDGTVNTEYWVVPAAAQASLGAVQAQVMPAAQAVQAVNKAYVDQSIAELTQSLLTASGGTLDGPLYLSGDPTQPLQAADKHYVDEGLALAVPLAGGNMTGPLTDSSGFVGPLIGDVTGNVSGSSANVTETVAVANGGTGATTAATALTNLGALPLAGGTLTGPLTGSEITATQLGGTYQVDQFLGVDLGAKLQACLGTLSASYGGTCDARNFTGTQQMGSTLTIATANATVLLPCATISTANQVIVTAGTRNVTLRGCALRGASTASGSQGGTVFLYSGTGAMVQVGDPTYAADTMGFHMDNAVINTTAAGNATAQGLAAYRTQEMDLESLYFLGNSNQTGITLDGTGNYTGGTFFDNAFNGFQTAVNAIGHQISNPATTDWMNASTFVRLHIDCPTSGGSPIGGTYGINLAAGDGNTFTGGDVEGCSTALHLGPNAQNNTIVGLRNENSNNQVVADAGSSYNNWMSGGTMFTGQLTDNGTRNSFLDTFHRSFNGMNGDWYGSQKDATMTNHYRIGIGAGNERGLLDRYQTDYGYRWTMGLSDATAGEQFYQVLDELNNVYRLSIGQYNNGQPSTNNQTVINAAGTGAVVLNGSNNSGTGGVVFGSGGTSETTVATISNQGNAQFNGTLQVGGTSTLIGTPTVKNQANAEIDATLWAGLTASQKESFIYKDWNGNSQWYMEKDASNNWELNSATGGLDSIKAYQSTNSGDTYINASNSSEVVRVNYETGSGAGFNIYGGGSSILYASFTGTTSIKFPGLAASSGVDCLQIDNSGYITNTGSACGSGSGGSGTIGSGNAGQIAYYTASGTAIGGMNMVPVTAGGTGAATAAGALANMGGAALAGAAFSGAITAPSTNGAQTVPPGRNIQAAINAAGNNGKVDLTPGTIYTVSATLTIPYSIFTFNGNGACIVSTAPGDGIYVTNAAQNVTLNDPCLMPGGASTGAAIHDASNTFGTTINRPRIGQNTGHTVAGGYYWYYGIQVDTDELFTLNSVNALYGVLRCDSTFCGSGIYNPGYSFPISSIAGNAGTYSFTLSSGNLLSLNVTGNQIHVSGTSGGAGIFNAFYTITSVTSDTTFTAVGFNYAGMPTGSGTATGGTLSSYFNAAVGYINDSSLTMGCYGNSVDWEGGNDLTLKSVILQAYNQFGLRVNMLAQGGSGNITASGAHNESGGCTNPALNGIMGSAGWIINNGAHLKLSNARGGGGRVPVFPNSDGVSDGGEDYAYYAVIHNAGGSTTTQPLPIGYTTMGAATLGGSHSVIVTAPTSTGTGDTCDYLRVDQSVQGRVSPFNTSGLNYAIPGEQGIACGPSAGSYVSFTDNTPTASLAPYTFNMVLPYGPALNNWPVTYVLTGVASNSNLSTFDGNCGIGSVFAVPAWPSYYQIGPNVTCEGPTEDDWTNNQTPYGGAFQNRMAGFNAMTNVPSAFQLPLSGGYEGTTYTKGAINFGTTHGYVSGATDAITIIDSNPFKTLATPGNRPVATQGADAGDTAIGLDQTSGGLALRDATSISFYINSLFGGLSYLDRLTASTALFKQATITLSGLPGLPASGNYCLHIGSTGNVTPTSADCSSGGSGSVSGPASSANNDLASFNGTTGQSIQDSGVSVSSGRITVPAAAAASTPAVALTGAPYTGATTTTNFPLLYLNDGNGPSTLSANGTEFGINAPSGFTGNLIDAHVNGGPSVFSVNYQGYVTAGSINGLNLGASSQGTYVGTYAGNVTTESTFGYAACYYINASLNYNTCLSWQAGEYITGGSTHNTGSTYSIYVGEGSMAKASGDIDENVICSGCAGNGSHTTTIGGTDQTGLYFAGVMVPEVLYSAAGTPLPSCASGIKGAQAVVSDASNPTYMGAYASGGTITAAVICSYNGTTYTWLTR